MEINQEQEVKLFQAMEHSLFRRAFLMCRVLQGYSLFDSIQLKRKCTNIEWTYKDAEFVAERLEEITGVEASPTDFLHDKNDLANELLDEYAKYQTVLNSFDETMRPIINSYYHFLHYYRKAYSDTIMPLQIALTALINYKGLIDKKELKNNFIAIDLVKKKTIITDSRYARHNFMSLEKDFNDICFKIANRSLMAAGEGACSNFTVNIVT